MRTKIEQSFVKYQQTREPKYLAAVFDATAADLLLTAIHLADDSDSAEDLVQATFLTVIQRARDHDLGRPLLPWLVGILSNHAKNQKRSMNRVLDRSRIKRPGGTTPLETLAARENRQAVTTAIDELDDPYRLTLLLHLRHGLCPADIAHVLNENPGTIRVRIHRGLDRLKGLLPAGIAVSILISTPGLAAVRSVVLTKAVQDTALVTSTPLAVFGGFIVAKKALIVSGLIVALAIVTWIAGRGLAEDDALDFETTEVEEVIPKPRREPRRSPVKEGQPLGADAARDESTSQELFTGKVVDGETGDPIVGADLAVYAPVKTTLIDFQRKWRHLARWNFDGSPTQQGWPALLGKLEPLTRAGRAEVEVCEPPGATSLPLARATSDKDGQFHIPLVDRPGILRCSREGFQDRFIVVGDAKAIEVVTMWPGKWLFGVVVDPQGHPIKEPVTLSFCAPSRASHRGRWTATTSPNGTFEVMVGAPQVVVQCMTRGYMLTDADFGGRRSAVMSSLKTGNDKKNPYQIAARKMATILVRDAVTKIPIEDVFLLSRDLQNGFLSISGRVFAPLGRIEIVGTQGFMFSDDSIRGMWRNKTYMVSLWAEGYEDAQVKVENLLSTTKDIVVELRPGRMSDLTGVVRQNSNPIKGVAVSVLALSSQGGWSGNGRNLIDATATDEKGNFRVKVPRGKYLLHLLIKDISHWRVVEVQRTQSIDIDLAHLAEILVKVQDSHGRASGDHTVIFQGLDRRNMRTSTNEEGEVRFAFLPAGTFKVFLPGAKPRGSFLAESAFNIELGPGELKRIDATLSSSAPSVFPHLSVKGEETLVGWKARWGGGRVRKVVAIAANGEIPIKVPSQEGTSIDIVAPGGAAWNFYVPKKLGDGWHIEIDLSGLKIDGRLLDWDGKLPVKGIHIRASLSGDYLGPSFLCASDDEGRFQLRGLKPGSYTLGLTIPWTRSWSRRRSTLPKTMSLKVGIQAKTSPSQLHVRLPLRNRQGVLSAAKIKGQVLVAGQASKNAQVNVVGIHETQAYTLFVVLENDFGSTDENGNYQVIAPRGLRYRAWVLVEDEGKRKRHGPIEWSEVGKPQVVRHDFSFD